LADPDALARELERERAARAAAEAQLGALEARLLEAEQRLARVTELEVQLRAAAVERDSAVERVARAERVHADMTSSLSWRITAPLRAVKQRGR
jgi:hypothetical protein